MRNGKRGVLTLLFLALPSIAFAQAWPNEPAGSTPVLDCAFASVTCGLLIDQYKNGALATDLSAPVSPPSVLNQLLPAGQTQGGAQLDYYFPASRQVYVGLWVKTNTEFTASNVGIGKLFFLGGAFNNSYFAYAGGYGNFDKTVMYNNQNSGIWNNCHYTGVGGSFGDCPGGMNFFGNVNGSSLVRGQWHRIEVCRKNSTTATSRDGIIRWWVDGTLRGNYTELNEHGTTTYFSLNHTWDGAGNVVPGKLPEATWQHLFDHLRISISDGASNCGGAGGGTSPPPPPSPTPPPPSPTPPPPSGTPGTVSDLAVVPLSSTTARVTFTQQDDGTGVAAKYDNRLAVSPISWGAASSVTVGPCSSPYAPTGIIGSQVSCDLSGLTPGQAYQMQNVAFRGTMNAGATYGSLGNIASFTMPSSNVPTITNFTPATGQAGTSITITGTNFGATIGANTVKCNGQTATITAASPTSLTVIAPDGVTTGKISVQTDQGIVYSEQNFTVGAQSNGCGCS